MYRSLLVAILVLVQQPAIGWAGSTFTLGQPVPSDRRVSIDQIDHAAWDVLLRKYCDDDGLVDYQSWHGSEQDRTTLTQYLAHLSRADPARRAGKTERMAYWINAYNAVTIAGIMREYPTTSIRNHTARLVGYNIWKDLLLTVADHTYSLEQIEHEKLRKMGDARIHFAIVCASIGCPRLLNRAYVAGRLEEQLEGNAQNFFANRRNFRYDSVRRQVELSAILQWYGDDFGSGRQALLSAIADWLPDAAARKLAASGQATIRYLDYDWNLNDQKTKKSHAE